MFRYILGYLLPRRPGICYIGSCNAIPWHHAKLRLMHAPSPWVGLVTRSKDSAFCPTPCVMPDSEAFTGLGITQDFLSWVGGGCNRKVFCFPCREAAYCAHFACVSGISYFMHASQLPLIRTSFDS
jgi:hypothetical protein